MRSGGLKLCVLYVANSFKPRSRRGESRLRGRRLLTGEQTSIPKIGFNDAFVSAQGISIALYDHAAGLQHITMAG